MHSSLALTGAHHKSVEGNKGKNFLVRWFYQYYWFFGYLCVGAELTYILLYLRIKVVVSPLSPHHDFVVVAQYVLSLALLVCAPGCVAKQMVNIAQLASSCYAIADHDAHNTQRTKAS
jgi:CDP-diacylglycerol--inositol 3-phosphatidyltransferase